MRDGEPALRKLLWTSCTLELRRFVAELPLFDELLRKECLITCTAAVLIGSSGTVWHTGSTMQAGKRGCQPLSIVHLVQRLLLFGAV